MLKSTVFGEAEASEGEWFEFQAADGESPAVELLIRHLPPAERGRITKKHLGKRREIHLRGNDSVQPYEPEKNIEANRESAAYCLLDSRGFTFKAGAAMAERLRLLLGKPELKADAVTLDGSWTAQVKDEMLRSSFGDELAAFVSEKAGEIIEQRRLAEEAARGN